VSSRVGSDGWPLSPPSAAAELRAEVDGQLAAIEEAYLSIVDGLPTGWSRKDFALVAARHAWYECRRGPGRSSTAAADP
jgi:hypothetical protein